MEQQRQQALEQALERERQTREQLDLLRRLNTLLLSGADISQVLQGFAEAVRSFIPFDRLSVSVFDEPTNREWLFVVFHDGPTWEMQQVKPFVTFGAAKRAMQMRQPILRPQLQPDEHPAERWLLEQGFRSSLVYPLPMRGQFQATLNFSSRTPENFRGEHIAFLNAIADQVAIAFHDLLSDEAEKKHREHLLTLLNLSASFLAARSMDDLIATVERSLRALGADHAAFFVHFPDRHVRQAELLKPGQFRWFEPQWLSQPLRPGEMVLGDVLLGLRAIFVTNDPLRETSQVERQEWQRQLNGQDFRFGNAVVPMGGHSGVLGAIAVDFRESRRFLSLTDEFVQMLLVLGNLAGLALENLWLESRIQQQLQETQVLHWLILEAVVGAELRQLAKSLVQTLPQVLPCDTVSVSLLTEDKGHLEFVATYPEPPPDIPLGFRLPVTKGIMGYVAKTGEPVLERDVRTNPHYFEGRSGTLSELCVPIKVGEEIVGVVNLESKRLEAFNEGHLAFLQTLAAQLGVVMERARLLHRQTELAQQLSAIFDSVQEGIALVLSDGRLDDVNRRFGDLLGLPAERLRGEPVEGLKEALMSRASNPEEMRKALDEALSDLTAPQFDLLELTEPDRFLERYCLPVYLPDGSLMGQLWVLRDVTEERRRQQELLRLERLRTLGELASGIAHDLNNALVPLMSGSELLKAHPDPEVRRWAETMFKSVRHAADIIQRMRGFYQTRLTVAQELVDIHQLVHDAIVMTRPRWLDTALAEDVTVRMETRLTDQLLTKGDPSELRQVFVNILLNAADAIMEKAKITGDREGNIVVTAKQQGSQVVVEITDDGIGMTEEVRQRMFKTFFTTKGERGSGLGMSIALVTVLLHNGNITVQSAPMQGTTVTVTLPASQRETVAVTPIAPQPTALPRWRVLVVDDQLPVLQSVVMQLKHLGQEAFTAANGAEGWEVLQRERVDLLVTDLSMPLMNGMELVRRVRQKFPQLPVVLMTGWGDFIPHETLKQAGVDLIVSKPMGLHAWRETLQKLMKSEE